MTKLAYVHDNSRVRDSLSGFMSYSDLPYWIEDCIRGAVGQINTGDKAVSPAVLFTMLRCLDEISVKTLSESTFNRKREVLYGKGYGERMLKYYASALRCASQAIEHQLLMGRSLDSGFNFYKDSMCYKQQSPN